MQAEDFRVEWLCSCIEPAGPLIGHATTERQSYFYMFLLDLGTERGHSNVDLTLARLVDLRSRHRDIQFHHPRLSPLHMGFTLESDILLLLLQTQARLSRLEFLESLQCLKECKEHLADWLRGTEHIAAKTEPTKKSGWFSFGKLLFSDVVASSLSIGYLSRSQGDNAANNATYVLKRIALKSLLMTNVSCWFNKIRIAVSHSKSDTVTVVIRLRNLFRSGTAPRQSTQLALCGWMRTFFELLLSKFSLYFCEALTKPASPADMKHNLSLLPAPNFLLKIAAFHKKQHECSTICLVINREEEPTGFQVCEWVAECANGTLISAAIGEISGLAPLSTVVIVLKWTSICNLIKTLGYWLPTSWARSSRISERSEWCVSRHISLSVWEAHRSQHVSGIRVFHF